MIITDKNWVGPWVSNRIKGPWNASAAETIGWSPDGLSLSAGVIYENWNGVSMMVHIAIEKPITKGFIDRIFGYAFTHASKLIAPIAESNEKSIRMVKKFGFRQEAQLLDAHPDGSLLIFTLTRQAFIGGKYGQRYKHPPRH